MPPAYRFAFLVLAFPLGVLSGLFEGVLEDDEFALRREFVAGLLEVADRPRT